MVRALALGLFLWGLPCLGFAATMPAVHMKVVDAQDGSPIAGAHVLFHGGAHAGTLTGHGGKSATLFVAETVTDDSGELRIPRQEFSAQPFFLNTNYHNPWMLIFKPGYVLVDLRNTVRSVAELKDLTTWLYNGQTIRMKRVTSDTETSRSVDGAATSAMRTLGPPDLCSWKKIPRFLVAVDRAAAEWNRRRDSLPDELLRRHTMMSPLDTVLMNDAFYVDKGCGSPKAFFAAYPR
jgi:hypothetical protein